MKAIFNKLIFFFLLCSIYSSCSDEIYETSIVSSKKIRVSTIDFEEFSKNKTALSKVDFIEQKRKFNNASRFVEDSIFKFIINTEEVKYIEKEGYHSFTFKVYRPNAEDDKLENLLLSSKESGGYDVYLIKYDFTKEELETLSKEQLDSKEVKYFLLDYSETSTNRFIMETCIYNYIEDCALPVFQGELYVHGYICDWILESYHCTYSGSGGTGPGSSVFDGGSSPVGGGSFGGYGGNGNNGTPPTTTSPNACARCPAFDEALFLALEYLQETLGLSSEERAFLRENKQVAFELQSYLIENTVNDIVNEEAIVFSQELIDYVRTNFTNQNDALDYVISEIIVEKINDSALDECTKGILNKLKNLQQNDIAKIMRRFDAPKSTFNVKFEQTSSGLSGYGRCEYSSNEPNKFDIKLNSDYFKNNGATHLGKAHVIIHEFLHALIYSVINNAGVANNLDSTNFSEIWNAYVNLKTGSSAPDQHYFMGLHYVKIMGAILQEYITGVPVLENQTPQQLYTDLAWGGVLVGWFNTANPQFITPFDSQHTTADKLRMVFTLSAEMNNANQNGINPSTNPSCLD